jgi:hypothetical protein
MMMMMRRRRRRRRRRISIDSAADDYPLLCTFHISQFLFASCYYTYSNLDFVQYLVQFFFFTREDKRFWNE